MEDGQNSFSGRYFQEDNDQSLPSYIWQEPARVGTHLTKHHVVHYSLSVGIIVHSRYIS